MPKSGTSEVPAPTNTSTPAATSSKRAAKGAATKKGTKNVDNATTKKGGKKADSATTKKRGEKVEPTIDAVNSPTHLTTKPQLTSIVPEMAANGVYL